MTAAAWLSGIVMCLGMGLIVESKYKYKCQCYPLRAGKLVEGSEYGMQKTTQKLGPLL